MCIVVDWKENYYCMKCGVVSGRDVITTARQSKIKQQIVVVRICWHMMGTTVKMNVNEWLLPPSFATLKIISVGVWADTEPHYNNLESCY